MMKNINTFFVILISIFIASCSSVPISERTNSPKLSTADTQIPPTKTSTPVSSITNTTMPEPTRESTPTIEPSIMAEVETLEAIMDVHPKLKESNDPRFCLINEICLHGDEARLSPDKKWATFSIPDKGYSIHIIGVENDKEWKVYFTDLWPYDDVNRSGTVHIVHWSNDGNYLYLTYADGSEGGYGDFWGNYDKLFRFNLNNGTWVDTNMGAAHAISPNDRYLAYHRGQELVIFEFQTGEERALKMPDEDYAFSKFTWSLDSSKLIFISSDNDFMHNGAPTGLNLVLLDVPTMQAETLLQYDERFLFPAEWISETQVVLCVENSVVSPDILPSLSLAYLLDLSDQSIKPYDYPNQSGKCYY